MFDPELDSFKTAIDLRVYAAAAGYQLDRKESWRGSAVMRHSNGDKVIIKRDANGHYVYFSVRDDNDHGSIIDFAQAREHLNLGEVRKHLRRFLGQPASPLPYSPLVPTSKDRIGVEQRFAQMTAAIHHPYLEIEREIPPALLQSSRFAGRIRIDARGNAIFPHEDADGLCGYEIKNREFTGFASGGRKALWLSAEEPSDTKLVFCESAIDALSHALLFSDTNARYASFAGQISPAQRDLIRAAAARMPSEAKVVAAVDADAEGGKLGAVVRESIDAAGRGDLTFALHQPVGFKDWNDQLRKRPLKILADPCPPHP